MVVDPFLERLRNGPPLVLDGPTGTGLERRGVDTSSPIWSSGAVRKRPDDVVAVHRAYAEAGADVHTTVTFRADRLAFARAGLDDEERRRTIRAAVRLARSGAKGVREAWIAGGIGPIGDCYAPDAVPDDGTLWREHRATAEALAEAGADILLFETINTVREGVACAAAGARLGIPVLVSFIVVPGGRLLSGEPLAGAARAVARAGADAVLVNCSTLPASQAAATVLATGALPWGAYANGSLAAPRTGWTAGEEVPPARFAEAASGWLAGGASMVGSCCGTTPEHTAALRRSVDMRAVRSG